MNAAELRAYEAGKAKSENDIAWRAWWIGCLCGAGVMLVTVWRWL